MVTIRTSSARPYIRIAKRGFPVYPVQALPSQCRPRVFGVGTSVDLVVTHRPGISWRGRGHAGKEVPMA